MVLERIKTLSLENYTETVFQVLDIQSASEIVKHYASFYRVLFLPSSHPEACITVRIKAKEFAYISLDTVQTNLWHYAGYVHKRDKGRWLTETPVPLKPQPWKEVAEVDSSLLANFSSTMNDLHELGNSSEAERLVLDGMEVYGEYGNNLEQYNSFSVVSPEKTSQEFQFVCTLYKLAIDTFKEEQSVRILENIYGYLDLGLPLKIIGDNPYHIRMFGRLSTTYEEELKDFLNKISRDKPLLMDLNNFEGMGASLYPIF